MAHVLRLIAVLVLACASVHSASVSSGADKSSKSSLSSIFVDDVIVESTLSVRGRKGGARQGRTGLQLETRPRPQPVAVQGTPGAAVLTLKRDRRQVQPRYYPQFNFPEFQGGFPQPRQPTFNSNAAQAQSQAFDARTPFGGFGGSASNSGSQGLSFDSNGIRANSGLAGSQSYHLPNGNNLALSYTGGFSIGPDGRPQITRGNSIAYTGANGQPVPGFSQSL